MSGETLYLCDAHECDNLTSPDSDYCWVHRLAALNSTSAVEVPSELASRPPMPRYDASDLAWRERALRAEAENRALREAIGELLDLADSANRQVNRQVADENPDGAGVDYCSCWDIPRSDCCTCGYEALLEAEREADRP